MQVSAPIPAPLTWSPRVAAAAIPVSPRTLWTLTQQGKIPHLRIGRLVRYRPEAVAAYLASLERSSDFAK